MVEYVGDVGEYVGDVGSDGFADDYRERYGSYIREISKKAENGSIYFSNGCNALFLSLPCPAIKYNISHSWSRKTFAINFEDIHSVQIKDCQLLLRTKSEKKKNKNNNIQLIEYDGMEEEEEEDSSSSDEDEEETESREEILVKEKISDVEESAFEEIMSESPYFSLWMDLATEQSGWPSIVVSSIHDSKKGTLVNPTGCFVIQRINDRYYVSDIQTSLSMHSDNQWVDRCRPCGISRIHLNAYNPRSTLSRLNYNNGFLTLFEDGSLHHITFKSPNNGGPNMNGFKFSQYEWSDNTFGFLSEWFKSQPWQKLLPPEQQIMADNNNTDQQITLFEQYTKLRADEFDINGTMTQSKLNENGSQLNQKYAYIASGTNEKENKHHLSFNLHSHSMNKTIIAVRLQFVDKQHTPNKVVINGISYPCLFSSVRARWNDIRLPKHLHSHSRNLRLEFPVMPNQQTPIINNIEIYSNVPNSRKRGLKRTQQLLLRQIPVLTRSVLYEYLKNLWILTEKKTFELTEYNNLSSNDETIDGMLDWLLMKSNEQTLELNKKQYINELLYILSELTEKPFISKKALNPTITNHVFRSLTKLVNNINNIRDFDINDPEINRTVSKFITILIKLCKHIFLEKNDAVNLQSTLFNINASIDMSSSYITEIIFGLLFYFASIYPSDGSMKMVMSFFTQSLLSENNLVRLCFANNILRSIQMKSLSFSISKLLSSKSAIKEPSTSNLQPLLLPNTIILEQNDNMTSHTIKSTMSSLMRLPSSKSFKKPQIRIKQTARRGKKSSNNNILPSFKNAAKNKDEPINDFFHSFVFLKNKSIKSKSIKYEEIGSSTSPPAILKDTFLNEDHLVIIPSEREREKERERERRKKRMIELQQHILRKERMSEPMSWGSNIYSFGDQNESNSIPIPLSMDTDSMNNMFEQIAADKFETAAGGHSGEALLQKWGISSFKRVSIVPCSNSNCNKIVKGGYRHICKHPQCNNFVLCPECHQDLTENERQQIHGGPWHAPHRPISLNVHQRSLAKNKNKTKLGISSTSNISSSSRIKKKSLSPIIIDQTPPHKGFRFNPLTKGSKAENIALSTLLNCIVDQISFKTRNGAEMLPLITVIVHLLCYQFANDLILIDKDDQKKNDKEEMDSSQIKKLINMIVSCLEYHIGILNNCEMLESKTKSIEMFIVLLDALLVMICHQQWIQEKIGAYKKSQNQPINIKKEVNIPKEKRRPSRVSWGFHPNPRMLSQLMSMAEASEVDQFGGYEEWQLMENDNIESDIQTLDVSAILDILPNETREPLEAAMSAASNHAERLEILRSNLPAMISSSPEHRNMFLELKRNKNKVKIKRNKSYEMVEDDITSKDNNDNNPEQPKIHFESKESVLISLIIKELSKDFGDKLLKLLNKTLSMISNNKINIESEINSEKIK